MTRGRIIWLAGKPGLIMFSSLWNETKCTKTILQEEWFYHQHPRSARLSARILRKQQALVGALKIHIQDRTYLRTARHFRRWSWKQSSSKLFSNGESKPSSQDGGCRVRPRRRWGWRTSGPTPSPWPSIISNRNICSFQESEGRVPEGSALETRMPFSRGMALLLTGRL